MQIAEAEAASLADTLMSLKKNIEGMLQEKENAMQDALAAQRDRLAKAHQDELESHKRGEQQRSDAAVRVVEDACKQKMADAETAHLAELEKMQLAAKKELNEAVSLVKTAARQRQDQLLEEIETLKKRESNASSSAQHLSKQIESVTRLLEQEKVCFGIRAWSHCYWLNVFCTWLNVLNIPCCACMHAPCACIWRDQNNDMQMIWTHV